MERQTDPCVMFLSDFGRDDIYVAEVELEFRKRIGGCSIIHVTHSIRPHDVAHAAILLASWINAGQRRGDVTVCMIDPDTACRIVIANCGGHWIVAPDNGCLTLVADQLEKVETWVDPILPDGEAETFRSRSVFPEIVSELLEGSSRRIENLSRMRIERHRDAQSIRHGTERLSGRLLHADHFGNVITNVPNAWIDSDHWRAEIGPLPVDRWFSAYHEAMSGELTLFRGSSGFVEISVHCGRASDFGELELGHSIEFFRTDTDSTTSSA